VLVPQHNAFSSAGITFAGFQANKEIEKERAQKAGTGSMWVPAPTARLLLSIIFPLGTSLSSGQGPENPVVLLLSYSSKPRSAEELL
jgi:hypothetical protein